MNFAAIDILNDVVLSVGSYAHCEEVVRSTCYEAQKNEGAYADEDTPVVTSIEDLSEKYRAMVDQHCADKGIGFDGKFAPLGCSKCNQCGALVDMKDTFKDTCVECGCDADWCDDESLIRNDIAWRKARDTE